MKFITLTGLNDKPIHINFHLVRCIYADEDGVTRIDFSETDYARVKETPEVIIFTGAGA